MRRIAPDRRWPTFVKPSFACSRSDGSFAASMPATMTCFFISLAMIARIERAESSATATLLGKLCAGLDVTLSAVVGLTGNPPERLARKADQPVWRDPETGYRRRHASAPHASSGVGIMVIDLPEGRRVSYSPWGRSAYTQQLLLLQGQLTVFVGGKRFELDEGDCLDFDVMRPVAFENAGPTRASHIVVVRHA